MIKEKDSMSFETITEKIFKDRVKVDISGLTYVEKGIDFIRFRVGEKLFEVKIKERKKK
jgi:hypothetical protein